MSSFHDRIYAPGEQNKARRSVIDDICINEICIRYCSSDSLIFNVTLFPIQVRKSYLNMNFFTFNSVFFIFTELSPSDLFFSADQMIIVIISYPLPERHLLFLKFHDFFQIQILYTFESGSPEIFKHLFRWDPCRLGSSLSISLE